MAITVLYHIQGEYPASKHSVGGINLHQGNRGNLFLKNQPISFISDILSMKDIL